VRLTAGGTEIVAVVTAPASGGTWPALLLQDVPRTASISAVSAHALLHTYLGGPTTWPGRTRYLDAEQQERLRRRPSAGAPADVALDAAGERMSRSSPGTGAPATPSSPPPPDGRRARSRAGCPRCATAG
jgi:hypothetical protein